MRHGDEILHNAFPEFRNSAMSAEGPGRESEGGLCVQVQGVGVITFLLDKVPGRTFFRVSMSKNVNTC